MKSIFNILIAVLLIFSEALPLYASPQNVAASLTAPSFVDTPSAQMTINGYQVPRILCQGTAGYPLYSAAGFAAATTTENTLATCAIPAGAMGLNGSIRIFAVYSLYNAASNNKVGRVRFGGTTPITGTVFDTSGNVTTPLSFTAFSQLWNRNSASSQLGTQSGQGFPASSSAANITSTYNTALAQTIYITGTTSAETPVAQTAMSGNGATCTATVAAGAYATGDQIYVTTGTGCGSGTQNVGSATTSVTATNISGTQYSYPCTCNGGTPVSGTGYRFSNIMLESYTVELFPGAN